MSGRESTEGEPAQVGVHDRVLAFGRRNGLTVRPHPTSPDAYTIEVPKGELVVEVLFFNTRTMTEWFVDVRGGDGGEVLWQNSWEHYASLDPAKDQFEEMSEYLLGFLAAVVTQPIRLGQVASEPFIRLFGWSFPRGERTELQLLIDGAWVSWDGGDDWIQWFAEEAGRHDPRG